MINAAPGSTFEAVTAAFAHSATVAIRIRTAAGADFLARTTSGVVEDVTVGSAALFRTSKTAPTVSGQYTIVWDDGTNVASEELVVGYSLGAGSAPSGRDLCAFSDVLAAVPGYDDGLSSNDKTNAKLQDLITSESDLIHLETGREIVQFNTGPRQFLVDQDDALVGVVDIGDLQTLEAATVEILGRDGTLSVTCDNSTLIARYGVSLNQRHVWDPITSLEFAKMRGAPEVKAGQTVQIAGPFGFPQIPGFIKTACVNRVILRYVSDVGIADQFGGALDRLNLAAMFASARDAVASIQRPLLP